MNGEEVKEDKGVVTVETDETHHEDESVEGETEDIDSRGKDGEAGEGGGGDEEESGGELEKEEPKESPEVHSLREEIQALKDQIAKGQSQEQPQPRVYTEDEKLKISTDFGGIPFETVQGFSGMVGRGLSMLEEKIEARLSKFEMENSIMNLSQKKEFADINAYKDGVVEYMKKFQPQHRGNEELLKDAYLWARGKNMKTTVKKIVNSTEKNRRISGEARPSSPSGRTSGKTQSFKLSPTEESAWKSFGEPNGMSREEYAKSLHRVA